jgi:hypothetical protein
MEFRTLASICLVSLTLSGSLGFAALSSVNPMIPKCFGVMTTAPNGSRILVCQNPCIGGGQGCVKVITDSPYGPGLTCKCQGGSVDCCDIWQMSDGQELAIGDCGTENCPTPGFCHKEEGGGGDVYASCD